MIREDDRLAQHPAARGQPRRVKLRQVQMHDVCLTGELPGHRPEAGHDYPLADAKSHRDAHHVHAVHDFVAREGRIVLRGKHSDLVALLDERVAQAFHVNR